MLKIRSGKRTLNHSFNPSSPWGTPQGEQQRKTTVVDYDAKRHTVQAVASQIMSSRVLNETIYTCYCQDATRSRALPITETGDAPNMRTGGGRKSKREDADHIWDPIRNGVNMPAVLTRHRTFIYVDLHRDVRQ
jgi:hypothetical protein